MTQITALKQFLDDQMPRALEMLRQMVEINSYTTNREGVKRLGRCTADIFATLGFAAEFVPSTNPAWGDHLLMKRNGTTKRSVAMISHLDTVFPPEEEQQNNFRWEVEGDLIYGPGTHDIKGGTVMMWLVLRALQEFAPDLFESITWHLFLNSSEEVLSEDFGEVCRVRMDSGTLAALIFESEGKLDQEHLLVVARKGRATWRATATGRGAHAGGRHAFGANAIVQLSHTIQKIASFSNYGRALTFNPAVIRGGTVLNRVPHEAVVEGEFRTFSPDVYAQARRELLGLSGPGEVISPNDRFPCQVQIEILHESRPWPRNKGTNDLFEVWRRAGEKIGVRVSMEERGGLSDGNLLWDAVPTLDGLGPWGDHGHCSERSADGSKVPEFVQISSFVPKASLNVVAILDLLRATAAEP